MEKEVIMHFSTLNKIPARSAFIAVLFGAAFLVGCGSSNGNSSDGSQEAGIPEGAIVIEKQGVFASGGTVTEPRPGKYDETQNWLDQTRAGTTTHVDHANTFYQIPVGADKSPMVFLHGYGQTRTGWQATPDVMVIWKGIWFMLLHQMIIVLRLMVLLVLILKKNLLVLFLVVQMMVQ